MTVQTFGDLAAICERHMDDDVVSYLARDIREKYRFVEVVGARIAEDAAALSRDAVVLKDFHAPCGKLVEEAVAMDRVTGSLDGLVVALKLRLRQLGEDVDV